jgi:hypothetical protein
MALKMQQRATRDPSIRQVRPDYRQVVGHHTGDDGLVSQKAFDVIHF